MFIYIYIWSHNLKFWIEIVTEEHTPLTENDGSTPGLVTSINKIHLLAVIDC